MFPSPNPLPDLADHFPGVRQRQAGLWADTLLSAMFVSWWDKKKLV